MCWCVSTISYPGLRYFPKDQSGHFARAVTVLPQWKEKLGLVDTTAEVSPVTLRVSVITKYQQPDSEKEQGEGKCFLTC